MNPLRAKQAFGAKTGGDHSLLVLTAIKPDMDARNAAAMQNEATQQGLAIPILTGATPPVLSTEFPRYLAFCARCQALARRLSGGSLSLAVGSEICRAMLRGMDTGVLLLLVQALVPVTHPATPDPATVPIPANHAPAVAKSGNLNWTESDSLNLWPMFHLLLKKHSDSSIVLDLWSDAKPVHYSGLAGATLYDWNVLYTNGFSGVSTTWDFTTAA